LEASLNVASCHSDKVGGFKGDEEFGLDDVVDMNFDKGFKLSTVRPFQDIKIFNVERLGKMQ